MVINVNITCLLALASVYMGVATSLLFRVGLYTLSLAGGVVMLFPEAERAG